jgi:cardiolipin synthase
MRHRRSLLLFVLPLVLFLALPSVASAGSSFWVKDRLGHLIGSVRGASIYDNGGSRVGHLEKDRLQPLQMWVIRDGNARPIAAVGVGTIREYVSGTIAGTVAKNDGRWIVKRTHHGYHLRGTVAGGCPARLAAAAVRLLCWSTTAPTYALTTVPEAGYQPVYRFISSARKSLDMTMYSLVDPEAIAALIADASRGVAVRVLLDSTPGNKAANQPAYDDLSAHGVKVRWAWPGVLWHQKSIVRDARAVAVMSCNLDAAYYPVIRGWIVVTDKPATVAGVEATFTTDFRRDDRRPTRGVAPKGSELIWAPGAQGPLVKLIGSARPGTTLYAEDEQLDSPVIVQALVAAAERGVSVDLTMTDSPYWTTALDTLVAGGVHVSLYAASAPIYIQSKAISVNDRSVYVGSINFTTAMMDADRNMGIITTDPTVVRGVTSTMAGDFAGATPYGGSLTALVRPNVTQ